MKDENYSQHEKCGYCNLYLLGKLQSGIKCETCNQVYHEDCFTTDSENPATDRRSSVMSDISSSETIVPIQSQDVFDCGGISRGDSEKRLAGRKPGSFLLRISPIEGDHIISRLTAGDRLRVDHLKVDKTEVGDVTFYSLKAGEGRRTILDLVNNHREDFQLFHPINCPLSAASREAEPETAEDEENHYDYVDQIDQEVNPEVVVVVTEEESFLGYNHGKITRAEAEEKLARQVEGTFLLREGTDGGLKISRVPHMSGSGNVIKHFIVHRDARDYYYLTGNNKFSSVEEMISFYQKVNNADKYWLGAPLYTPEALEKVSLGSPQQSKTSIFSYQKSLEQNLTDDQMMRNRDNSRRGEPGSLPYYHGTMCSSAANKTLVRESPGTFLVRKTPNQQFFLSYKTVSTRQIVHSKINSTQSQNSIRTYYSIEPSTRARAFTSIRRLVDNLKKEKVLTIGLITRGRNPTSTTSTPSNSFDLGLEPGQLETSGDADIPLISKEEVQNMLKKSAHGTYVVRKNERGEVRVSYVVKSSVKHKMLFRQPGDLFTTSKGPEAPVSLGRIITFMKEQKTILNEYREY